MGRRIGLPPVASNLGFCVMCNVGTFHLPRICVTARNLCIVTYHNVIINSSFGMVNDIPNYFQIVSVPFSLLECATNKLLRSVERNSLPSLRALQRTGVHKIPVLPRAGYSGSRSSISRPRTWDHVLVDHTARSIVMALGWLASNWRCHCR